MCSKQNRKFKSKHVQHDYRKKMYQSPYYANINLSLIKENVTQIKSRMMIHIDASLKIRKKNHRVCKKDYIFNPATYNSKNGKYLGSIINDSVITSHEITETAKAVTTETSRKKCFN